MAFGLNFVYMSLNNIWGGPPEDGLNRFYYPNGKLQRQFYADNEKLDGYTMTYFPNGQLEFFFKYKDGKQVDTSYTFYESGNIATFEIFENGERVRSISFSDSTKLRGSEYFNPTDSLQFNHHVTYYDNGNKEFETIISNKQGHEGEGFYYYTNGRVKLKGHYREGNEHGVWVKLDSLTGAIIDRDTFDYKINKPYKAGW